MPSVEVTARQWKFFQRITGQSRPGGKIREALDEYMEQHAVEQTVKSLGVAPARTTLADALASQASHAGRHTSIDDSDYAVSWANLGCAKRLLDEFNLARDWYVSHFTDEQAAVAELEQRHAAEGLTNPRGWIFRKWQDAGSPGK